jgi:hypothetical protein
VIEQGHTKRGNDWTGGLELHEVLQDKGMRVARALMRAHGAGGGVELDMKGCISGCVGLKKEEGAA